MVIFKILKQIYGLECFITIWDLSPSDIDVVICKGQQLFMFVSDVCLQNEMSIQRRVISFLGGTL